MHETVQELGGGQAGVGDQRSFFALMERRRCGQEHGRSREGAEAHLNGPGPVAGFRRWGSASIALLPATRGIGSAETCAKHAARSDVWFHAERAHPWDDCGNLNPF